MSYYYKVSSAGKSIPIRGHNFGYVYGYQPAVVHASYSFRTGRKSAGTLALGELRLNRKLGSVSDYLKAEQTAIKELNSEIEQSSTLGEGTWGLRDNGHVFSAVRQTFRPVHYEYRLPGGDFSQNYSHDCAWFTPFVDPITASVFKTYNRSPGDPLWVIDYDRQLNMQDFAREASELLWKMNPDVISGSLGQDLVDLAELPKLLTHLRDLASALDSLKNKWGRLSRDVQDVVDLLFQEIPRDSARYRQRLKQLRAMPKRSLSKGSAAYLEWEFVLSPYIDDIRLMLRVLGQLSGATISTTRRSRTSHEHRLSSTDSGGMAIVPNLGSTPLAVSSAIWPSKVQYWRTLRYDISVHAKWGLRGATLDPFVQKAVDLNKQLGFIYPSLLWDLVPWTFLIDWFLHIGTTIDRVTYYAKGRYTPVYAWATIKGSSGEGWEQPPSPFFGVPEEISCPWPGMPVTNWTTRFPVSLTDGIKPQWSQLSSSARSLLAALGFSRLK